MVTKNDIEMYSSHHEVKSVIVEKFIKTLKNESYKYINYLQIRFQKVMILIN